MAWMTDRRVGGWMLAGAIVGYVVPFLWWSFLITWGAGDSDFDVGGVAFCLGFLLLVYTYTGLCLVGIAIGAGCGFACAWLPKRLRLWQRQALFMTLILLTAPAVDYIWALHPSWLASFPGFS